jgi:hypothetical protein
MLLTLINSVLLFILITSTMTSFLSYSFSASQLSLLSVNPFLPRQAVAQQGEDSSSEPEGQEDETGSQQGAEADTSASECPPNQHNVPSTNACEWDNCGLSSPPMYRNTITGRCVSDCSDIGQYWVKQGNTCVLNEGDNATSTQAGLTGGPIPDLGGANGNTTTQPGPVADALSPDVEREGNVTSAQAAPGDTIASLAGEPPLPYACYSNTFTCYCDGTEDCNKLTASAECKGEVKPVEGKPGLAVCDWNTG